jgi:class 3 adenylate cyclase/tetratricopeptide (TPR) repeat protein
MTFEELLDQALALLQRRGRVTYRALKRQFDLDDDVLEDLKAEIIKAQRLGVDEEGEVLVWTGGAAATTAPGPTPPQRTQPPNTRAVESLQIHSPPPEPRPREAERRQLTVLFCDVVDSTALAERLDPEDLREVIRAYQQTCAEVIQGLEGHIAQYLGDGLLVYFGYPQAHEDDAQRAIRAGLEMVKALRTLNTRLVREKGLQLAIRLGIHTGIVVVGDMGGGGRHEQLALGDTPNVAARLQGIAAPNTVLISAATHRLVEGYFACEAGGSHRLKGVSQPLAVYRVLQDRGVHSRLDIAAPGGLTPLVGRESEVTLLLERWTRSKDGAGQVVFLSGEPGIGKSRLVELLREHVGSEGCPRLVFRCSPYHTNSALYPVIEHLKQRLQWQPEDTPDVKLAKLEQGLRSYYFASETVVALLATLLSVPLPEGRDPPVHLSPPQQKQQTWDALTTWVVEEARRQPVLVVYEDLHWADPSTLEWLSLLIEEVPTARMLALLTGRPEFRPPWPPRSHVTQLTLTRFTRAQVEHMIAQVMRGQPLPEAVVQQVLAKTDGVPLFVEELLKMIVESGLVREEEGRYVLTGPLPPLAIPSTLHDSLMARLDRLATVREIAQLGAVLGREFSYEVIRAVAPWDEPTVQHGLAQLVEAELIYRRGLPPRATYLFKHALIQDAAYQSLLKSTRQLYHQRIAQVLEARFPETVETEPELLAHHYTEAGLYALALAFWKRAGDRAVGRSAHREATVCFEQALEAMQQLPESRATREQAIDLRLALRTALTPSGAFARTLTILHEAEALAEALDDSWRLGQVSLFMTIHCYYSGEPDRAIAAGQRALALATAGGEVGLPAVTNTYLGLAYHAQGDYQQAMACLRRTVTSLASTPRHERFGQVILPVVSSRAWLTWCLAEVGRFTEGLAIGAEGRHMAEAVGHPGSLMIACWGAGLPSLRQGDLPQALPRLERAMEICQDADLRLYFPLIAWPLGVAYAQCGRAADALPLLDQAAEQSAALGYAAHRALYVGVRGEALLLAGRLEEAHHCAEQALALAREHQERGNAAYALRLLGEIAAQREPLEVEQGEASYQQALALAEELGMRPLQAHGHLGLGKLYLKIGQLEQARVELAAALELYRAMEMTFWLPQAEAALAQVEGR